MKTWILPCNVEKKYDVFGAFDKSNKLDWHQTKQTKSIDVGDIAYIYANKQGICFKCKVTKTGIYGREIDDTEFCLYADYEDGNKEYFEIECITKYPEDEFIEYSALKEHGLRASLQGPLRVNRELLDYIESCFPDATDTGIECYSWKIINEDTIIKKTDKSVFEHRGSGVPKDTQWFFEVEDLPYGVKCELSLTYGGNKYSAYISREAALGRTRMFWEPALATEFKKYYAKCSVFPLLMFYRKDKNCFDIQFIGDDATVEIIDTPNVTQINENKLRNMAEVRSTNVPKQDTVTTVVTHRDAYIAEYARRRANGICQLCGNPAPFNNAQGEPYLETHHIVWLSKGGADSIDNTVALCPNCHRKMHIVNDGEEQKLLLKKAKQVTEGSC